MKSKNRKRQTKLKKAFFSSILGFLIICFFWVTESSFISHPSEPGNCAEIYSNQMHDDLRQVFLAGMKDAKKSILLIIYTLTDPQIISELRKKAEEGIDVRIICDAKEAHKFGSKLGKKAKVFRRISAGLMHQKILVIDSMRTWIGSANMTSESLRMHGNLVTAFNSPRMAEAIKNKADQMCSQSNILHDVPHEFEIADQKVELWFFPDNPYGAERLTQLIRSAQKSVRIAMFTFTRTDLAEEVVEAHKRGVKTEVVVDYHSGKGASAKIVEMLQQKGISIFLSQGNGLLHHKFMCIDEKTLVNGSANWTKAAFTKNDDCFIILHNLTDGQKQSLDKLWSVLLAETLDNKQ